jgi:hypothetical protein
VDRHRGALALHAALRRGAPLLCCNILRLCTIVYPLQCISCIRLFLCSKLQRDGLRNRPSTQILVRVQKQGMSSSKVVLIRSAIGAARARAAFAAVTPTLMEDITICKNVIQEALELLPYDDHQLQRVRPCLPLVEHRIPCVDAWSQPADLGSIKRQVFGIAISHDAGSAGLTWAHHNERC